MSQGRQTSTYTARLIAAIAVFAALVLIQGMVSIWIASSAEDKVQRSRISADIQAGFLDLARTKDRLQSWSLEVLLDTVPASDEGERLSAYLLASLGRLSALASEAEAMDGGDQEAKHVLRRQTIETLKPALEKLRTEVNALDAISPTRDPLEAWAKLEKTFTVVDGRQLGELIERAIANETEALDEKRSSANASLATLKQVAIGTMVSMTILAGLVAVWLVQGLRRPMASLSKGVAALQSGRLDHRIAIERPDEFGQLAAGFNAMAEELELHRSAESAARERLEDEVAARTGSLNDALADLRESEGRRRRLVAEISHELRTPTTAIRGEAEVALRAKQNKADDYREALIRIVDASEQLSKVVEDLVTVARSDMGALSVIRETVDLREIVQRAVAQAKSIATLRGVSLQDPLEGTPMVAMGDPTRLGQVLSVLIDNAIRYSSSGGEVSVAMKHAPQGDEGKCVMIEVTDKGIGIPETELDRVFESQYRSENARRHRPDGLGLGLTIARDLARRMGGEIALKSSPSGTLARLTLPVADDTSDETGDA